MRIESLEAKMTDYKVTSVSDPVAGRESSGTWFPTIWASRGAKEP